MKIILEKLLFVVRLCNYSIWKINLEKLVSKIEIKEYINIAYLKYYIAGHVACVGIGLNTIWNIFTINHELVQKAIYNAFSIALVVRHQRSFCCVLENAESQAIIKCESTRKVSNLRRY